MAQFSFGAGSLYGISTASGTPTPVKFGTLQEVSIETSFNTKELYGSYQFPVAIARGTGKVTGKAKFAQINGAIYNELFFGQTSTVGQVATITGEAGNIPATPFTITVANSATFVDDLGVQFSLTGAPLTKVAATPSTGEYSVSAGVYTFNAADTLLDVSISYTYTIAATGNTIVVNNQLLGTTPFFSCYFSSIYNGKAVNYQLPLCTSGKLTMATKLEDFVVPELDFSAFADASGKIMTISTAE